MKVGELISIYDGDSITIYKYRKNNKWEDVDYFRKPEIKTWKEYLKSDLGIKLKKYLNKQVDNFDNDDYKSINIFLTDMRQPLTQKRTKNKLG